MSSFYNHAVNSYITQGQPPALENNWLKHKRVKLSKAEAKAACVDVAGNTISNCVNTPVPINALTSGVVARIPVVLAELIIQLNINTCIDFPEPVLKIKMIDNSLKVTQCLLLQDTNMLFIKGFIRKIQIWQR